MDSPIIIHKSQDVLNRNLTNSKAQRLLREAYAIPYNEPMRVSVLGFAIPLVKIQVIMALTLDGFLPHEDEMLVRWVRENK